MTTKSTPTGLIPTEVLWKLMHQILDNNEAVGVRTAHKIRDAISSAYAEAWERSEEHTKETAPDWYQPEPTERF